jgi:hypothetical protein
MPCKIRRIVPRNRNSTIQIQTSVKEVFCQLSRAKPNLALSARSERLHCWTTQDRLCKSDDDTLVWKALTHLLAGASGDLSE